MSKLQSFPYAGRRFGLENRNTACRKMLQRPAVPFAISRRNGASHADEIILLLNWFRGATFRFLVPKRLTAAQWKLAIGAFHAINRHSPANTVYSFLQFPCLKLVVIG
jgi:hypothetical protein